MVAYFQEDAAWLKKWCIYQCVSLALLITMFFLILVIINETVSAIPIVIIIVFLVYRIYTIHIIRCYANTTKNVPENTTVSHPALESVDAPKSVDGASVGHI